MFVNTIVAISNFFALYFTKNKILTKTQKLIMFSPMVASFVYHLSETKHGLKGFPYLNNFSNELLNIDRFFAMTSSIFILSKIYYDKNIINKILCYALFGFFCLFMSERDVVFKIFNIYNDFEINKEQFLFFHCLWHLLAFKILSICI